MKRTIVIQITATERSCRGCHGRWDLAPLPGETDESTYCGVFNARIGDRGAEGERLAICRAAERKAIQEPTP